MAKKINSETERKIKQAAKEIFLKKGYNGARTREITEKAGVNLALLNYYFGGKKELFEVVISETVEDFKNTMLGILNNPETSFEEKVTNFTETYLSGFIKSHRLLPFILESVRENITYVEKKIREEKNVFSKTSFAKQYIEKTGKNIDEFKSFFINFLGMVSFPIIGAPLITAFFEFEEKDYFEFINKRKKTIPQLVLKLL